MGQTSTGTLRASPVKLALSLFALVALALSLFAFANPVRATDATIAIFKQMCASIGQQNVCNGRDTSLNGYHIDYDVFDEEGDLIDTITVTLGLNAGGGGNVGAGSQGRSTDEAFDSNTTYLVCEVEVAYLGEDEVPLVVTPRPDLSTGGTNQNRLGEDDRCIETDLTDGAAELKFLDQRADAPPTVTDVNLLKRDDDGRALDVSFTLASNTTDFSITVATGSDGSLVFEDLFEDEYTLTETAPVGCTGIGELTVTVNGDGTVTVETDPRVTFNATTNTLTINNDCGSLLNLVKRNQSGTALASVSFTLTASGQTTGTTLLTNALGMLTFPDLDPGNYTLSETAPAGCTGIGSITLAIAANGNVTLSTLNAAVAVNGNTLTIANNCPALLVLTPTLVIDKVANVETVTIVDGTATPATITWTLSYTLTNGPVTGAVITDTLPTGLDYVAGSATPAAGFTLSADGRTLTWNFATLSTSGSVSFQTSINVATILSPTVNLATIDSNETTPDTGQDQVTVTRQSTAGGNPPVRESTLAAAVPNTAMDAPMNQLPVVFLALLTLGSLGYLGRRNLIGIRNRR